MKNLKKSLMLKTSLNDEIIDKITTKDKDIKINNKKIVVKSNISKNKFPKKIHLGTREKIIDHLIKYLNFDENIIKKEWYFILKREIRYYFDKKSKRFVDGIIYAKCLDMIIKNPTGFDRDTWNLDTILPLKKIR